MAATNPAFQENLQRMLNNLEELNYKEGIRTGAKQALPAADLIRNGLSQKHPTTVLSGTLLSRHLSPDQNNTSGVRR